ncbi:transcriptional repressor LexA [Thermophilibacter provencensis]|uniref:LexA repressor n=1 Tax=Thermophilibacter provencensis TaxID=1852386 RepID=A0A921GF29_9ACTN|nr:transcriptional repressor LexA [Thermophilibacter provencensis]MBM6814443.1 transcriptional repressor LexA [Olsenella uli]HJF44674.1 transcriptional repressor LexA [Thermophilibacter provencensis]
MARGKLGKRQLAIYDFIRTYSTEHGYPPSVREIGAAVGLASPSTVHMHLKVLEEHGLIRRDSKKPRTIEVVDKQASSADDQVPQASVSQDVDRNLISLPLVGRVAAGTPILAEQNVEETLTLPTSIVGDASSFILRVRGESMINAGIFDGDYIVVKEQRDAHNGEIVVALIDDSATVKTFYRERDRVRLQPENDSMDPIYVDDPVILGRVTALIRSIS